MTGFLPPLPTLPSTTPGTRAAWRPAGPDLVDLLCDGHAQLGALGAELARVTVPPRRRREIVDVLVATATRHLSAEEQYLYPAVRAVVPGGRRLAEREINLDEAIRRDLRDLGTAVPGEPAFERAVARVTARLLHHARTAATEVLPALRAALPGEDRIRLGNRLTLAAEAAPTRPYPAAPASPPWNKVVEPALGLLDKLRDAVTGRPTYPEDL